MLWEPEFNESVFAELKRELTRFPYLSDRNRTDEKIEGLIFNLFDAPTSIPIEYGGGYIIFREFDGEKADVFWIHREGRKFGRNYVRAAKQLLDAAFASLGVAALTMRTASDSLVKLAERVGFKMERTDPHGFEWMGKTMPMYYLCMEG